MPSTYKSSGGITRLFKACRYSANGLRSAFRHEAAFRQEVALSAVLVPVALWMGQNPIEIACLLGSLLLVLIVELLNSAIETVADAVTLEESALIGRAKDIGSASVLLAIVLAILVWGTVIYGR